MINTQILSYELEQAGIPNGGCNSAGIVWDMGGETEIQDLPEVAAVIAAHDPGAVVLPHDVARQTVINLPGWVDWTSDEAEAWISANVTDLDSAKVAMQAMARLLVALRDKNWPNLGA